ncbi:CCAAT/enhancer-binding protein zeta-like [Haliotis asinina]|uniref:CCAAT/enhancer-binding protein zeta-like n=1 Tax=Haliotis asinina TaxID=109174 RepID=UPI0035319822
MAGKSKKKTRVSKLENKSVDLPKKIKEKLTIDTIVSLGGNKNDLQLVADLEDTEEDIEGFVEDFDAEPVKHDEIRDLIKKLDLHKYRDQSIIADEDEADDEDVSAPKDEDKDETVTQEEQIKAVSSSTKKKKKKNKFKVQDDEISSSTDPVDYSQLRTIRVDWDKHITTYKPRKYLILKGTERWYDEDEAPNIGQTTESVVQQMESFASKLLVDEVALYAKQRENSKRSDTKWMKTVLASGTSSDKIAALTLLVGESPVHNLTSMETLLNMARKKSKREAMAAVEALKDLFLSDLLPSHRKLKSFYQQSLPGLERLASGNKDTIDKTLLLWYFENQLKEKYAAFIKAVHTMSHDTLTTPKETALSTIYYLLANKPEGEKELLPMLANKLGDPDYKIAAKASFLLTRLVSQHPNMNAVVASAVEVILYRPNISERAQYYAMCFLNQIVLDAEDEELASQLIKIYFSFFRAFVQKGEIDSKMMSALLTGVHRAFPYAKGEKSYLSEQLDSLYKIVHLVNFNTSVQALMLLHHVTDSRETLSDRFYVALYKKLASPALKTSSKQAMFLNLIFKTMRTDMSQKRIKAFIKRLLQVCSYHSPQFVCGVLFMLSEVIKKRPDIINFSQSFEDSDDEEHFVDLPEEDEMPSQAAREGGEGKSEVKVKDKMEVKKNLKSSWVHRRNKQDKMTLGTYDPFHRNPVYCGADQACVWELEKLANHFHPSVALFAKTLLQKSPIVYTSDPLQDFTLIKFLNRFVYKNPKKLEAVSKSVMSAKQSVPKNQVPVTSDSFIDRDENSIPEDEKYLYKYFSQKSVRDKLKGKDDGSDVDSVSDGEFDEYLDKFERGADQGEDFWDFDFAGEFGKKKSKSKKSSKVPEDEEEESDDDIDDIDDDLSGEEMDLDDDDLAAEFKAEMEDAMGDGEEEEEFDEEEVEFSDEDGLEGLSSRKRGADLGEDDFMPTQRKRKKDKSKHDSGSLFAAAEEFSHLLDSEGVGGQALLAGGTHDMSNTDNSSAKQLKWEAKRDQWIKGDSWKSRRRQKGSKGNFKHKKNFKAKGGFKFKGGKQKAGKM